MRRPHQNRLPVQPHRGQAPATPLQRLDLFADPARLFLAIPMADQTNLLALLDLGPQRLAQPPGIPGNHAARRRQNMWRRPVILLQPHHMRAGKILFEPQDVAHLGPAPAIDRLVVIPHAADVPMRLRQQPQPQILADVGILILVHQNVAEPPLILRQHIRVGLKDHHAMQQQIAKIAGIQRAQPFLILRIQLRPAVVVAPRLAGWHLLRRQRAVLPAIDHPRQHPRGPAFLIDIRGQDQLLQQPHLIIRVQNGEVRFQPHQLRMPPQDLHAQ